MPPLPDAPFWMLHDGRVIPRRPRRILREQDEAITAERLVDQINAVPRDHRPTPGAPIQLGKSASRAPVLRIQPPKQPLRVLGMYTVPNGDHEPMVQMCKDQTALQAKRLRSRAMTDKMALFVVRAAMMPALTYKMQGHAFTHQQIDQIAMPLMQALKHACGLPISIPSSFLHHRLAGKVPRLETVHTANNLTLLVRAMNASTPLGEIALTRIAATEHRTCFPGPMLEIPGTSARST